MKNALLVVAVAVLLSVPGSAAAQQKPAPASLAQLELTMEVAATTDQGYPSAMRIIVKNNGALPVDMPMPEDGCVVGGGGVQVRSQWHAVDPDDHSGSAAGGAVACFSDVFPSLQFRVENEWIRLRPGEFVSFTQNVRRDFRDRKPGIIDLWAEYVPPELKPEELAALEQAGRIVPTEKLETEHQTFTIR